MSILDTIVSYKKKEVASCRELIPERTLRNMPSFNRQTYSLSKSLLDSERTAVITEFKRKSPSKGIINDSVAVEDVTKSYARYGASGLSVLTDFNFFGGSNDDLQKTREVNQIPVLRKEFIIDPYQVVEAKAIGADAILLIAAILSKNEAENLARTAHDLGLEVLMEFHDPGELDRLNNHVDIAGVNNRNLKTFELSLTHSVSLARLIPEKYLKISESGISSAEDLLFLRKHGFQGFLIGENFMKSEDPGLAFRIFMDSVSNT